MRIGRIVLALLLLVVVLGSTTVATLAALRPVAPRAIRPPSGERTARLSHHVLFVVVDGLRWDIARRHDMMPQFSRAMAEHPSAEVWASPISMTSSAVLAYGTGQRGSLDQVLENLRLPRTSYNSWLQNAKQAGLRLMAVGDAAWSQLYGPNLAEFRGDPAAVAIEADFNAQTFRHARQLQLLAPDFLAVHFVTPDHQGHAYGIESARYVEHMRAFDRALFEWLGTVAPDWTIVVTSDHGAARSGTHGSDTPEQRRCPLFAMGAAIRKTAAPSRALDQVELPGLFAALLGVPNAAQSRGAAFTDWLDVSAGTRQQLACAEIERLLQVNSRDASPRNATNRASATLLRPTGTRW